MEKELYEKGELKIDIKDGNLVLAYEGAGGSSVNTIKSDYFLDKLKEAIPGKLDDTIIDVLKVAFKAA